VHTIEFLNISTTTNQVFVYLIGLYATILIPYYWWQPKIISKARYVIGYILRTNKSPLTKQEQTAFLALAVKWFFLPIMVHWLLGHIALMCTIIYQTLQNMEHLTLIDLFNTSLFQSLFQTILFLDVFFFTIGYMIEWRKLGNEIISVESTMFGWVVCLICYPPFNTGFNAIVGWTSSDNPQLMQTSPTLHIIANIAILVLMGVYMLASVSLNMKASNLTNRGIVTTGVYAIVRHPAYITKNLSWWIGGLPAMFLTYQTSLISFIAVLCSLATWTFIYFLRAITEERHLLETDNGYREYTKKVRYRFIPGII
jgi:protein-S-isoprenylcysteine O-methyltransferase Ste14